MDTKGSNASCPLYGNDYPYNPESQQFYAKLSALGLNEQQSSAYLAKIITNQGLIISANEIFWLSAGVFIALLVLLWWAKPPFTAGDSQNSGGAH